MDYRLSFFIPVFFLLSFAVNAQEAKRDSLREELLMADRDEKVPLYLLLSELFSNNSHDTSLFYADSAILLLETLEDDEQTAEAYYNLGRIYLDNRKYELSLEYFLLANEKFIKSENSKRQADIAISLSQLYTSLKDYDKSIDYLNRAIVLAEEIDEPYSIAKALHQQGKIFNRMNKGEEALEAYTRALELSRELEDRELYAQISNSIGSYYSVRAEFQNAIDFYEITLEVYNEIENERGIGMVMNNLGNQHLQLGNFDEAVNYYREASEIFKKLNFDRGTAATLTGMAVIYENLGEYPSVLDVYTEVLELRRKEPVDSFELANTLSNLAVTYSLMLNDSLESLYGANFQDSIYIYDEAPAIGYGQRSVEYNLESLAIRRQILDMRGVAITLANLGIVYQSLAEFEKADDYFNEWMQLPEEVQDENTEVSVNIGLGRNMMYEENYDQAIIYFNNAYRLANEMNKKTSIREAARNLSDLYEKTGNFERSLDYFKIFHQAYSTLIQEKSREQIHEMQVKYETEAREKENEILRSKQLISETKLKNSRRALIASIIGLLVFAGLVIQLIRQNNLRRKANEELEMKNQLILEQTQEITDSIQYASRIQSAVLPPKEYIQKLLPEQFLIYRPRDIVSGDYYWLTQKGDRIICIVADCTGHGVPGAFMSMLGIAFLNEIVSKHKKVSTDMMLNELRDQVIGSLHQTGKEGESQDGMDVSLFILDQKTLRVEYSGANNPLVIVRDGELIELKPDKMPIGIHTRSELPFSKKEFQLKKGDMLYAFSDGYPDQFGGPQGKKFMIRKFKKLLVEIFSKNADEQKKILEKTLDDWMANVQQIDDILVMGVRI